MNIDHAIRHWVNVCLLNKLHSVLVQLQEKCGGYAMLMLVSTEYQKQLEEMLRDRWFVQEIVAIRYIFLFTTEFILILLRGVSAATSTTGGLL